MDGTTEPVVAVIGHPIAGNPSQFAIERALLSLNKPWRVVSFDVAPDRIGPALEGLEVLAFRGVLIDPSLSVAATHWYREKGDRDADGPPVGCLYRDPDEAEHFLGDHPATRWLSERIETHFRARDSTPESKLWIGDEDPLFASEWSEFDSDAIRKRVHDPDAMSSLDLVFISSRGGRPVEITIDEWPPSDASTLIVDLTEGHPDQDRMRQLGYSLVGREAIRIGTIQESMRKWAGEAPPAEVIQEAIEEYLAV